MSESQTLEKQIKALHKELEALRTDEAELSRLHAEKSAELEAMRGSKSRDFAGMAALEGQRAALHTMLEEQRGEIGQTEARVTALEAQREREAALERIGAKAARIMALRGDLHGGLLALVESLTPELERLVTLRSEWQAVRAALIEEAREVGGIVRGGPWNQAHFSSDFLHDLTERGVDADGVRLTLGGFMPEIGGSRDDALPTPPYGERLSYDPFPDQVRRMVGDLFDSAVHRHANAHSAKARAYRAQKTQEGGAA